MSLSRIPTMSPRHFRVQGSEGGAHGPGGLAEDLEVAQHRVLGARVFEEPLAAVRRVFLDAVDALEHIKEPQPVLGQTGTASLKMASRTCGFRPPRDTTWTGTA